MAKNGPKPFHSLSTQQLLKGSDLVFGLLRGVGAGKAKLFRTDPAGAAIHGQKPLTEREIALLPEGWMEIPAVDDKGPCVPINLIQHSAINHE
jgi:hypothetical protein